jgi:hypothetical protein
MALDQHLPLVALESTIISHGMPYPANVKTAQEVEQVVRDAGAVPATIAILDGIIRVGLTPSQLETLGRLGHKAQKCSRRDLAYVLATGAPGATTVAATMLIAHQAGIPIFVTGGIGGVHRGAEVTMDVSADLTELGQTPVAVICAGIKSILDIPKTLEVLETQGVAVIGLGTKEFPAFFTPSSGCPAPLTLDTPAQCAAMIGTSCGRQYCITAGDQLVHMCRCMRMHAALLLSGVLIRTSRLVLHFSRSEFRRCQSTTPADKWVSDCCAHPGASGSRGPATSSRARYCYCRGLGLEYRGSGRDSFLAATGQRVDKR